MIKKIIIGFISGFITGLFATGGGTILVPAFVYILGMKEKEARATAISCILPSTLVSFIFYAKDNSIDFKLSLFCAIGGIIGAIIGAKLLNKLPDNVLKICFSIFLIYVSVKYIIS